MKQDILNLENKNVGSIELNDAIFGLDVRADILHRVVNWQLARLQAGTHKTKGRSEVALTRQNRSNKKVPVMLVRVLARVLSSVRVALYSVRLFVITLTN